VAPGVPLKVTVALLPEQTVALPETEAVGSGNIVMVTVDDAGAHGPLFTAYVKMYGLPARVIEAGLTVPKCPLEVAIGPLQVPVVSGVPPSNEKRLNGGAAATWFAQMLRLPLVPALLGAKSCAVTCSRSGLSHGGSTVVA
jgi:hypothetical protein